MKSAIRKGRADVDSDIAASTGEAQAKAETEGQTSVAVTPPATKPMSGLVKGPSTTDSKTSHAQSLVANTASTQPGNSSSQSESLVSSAIKYSGVKLPEVGSKEAASLLASAAITSSAIPTQPFVSSQSTSMGGASTQSVAPNSEGSYNRVESRSKLIEKTMSSENTGRNSTNGQSTNQTVANDIPLYLGDMGMLTLNLGIGA
jgi:hypothetical protein